MGELLTEDGYNEFREFLINVYSEEDAVNLEKTLLRHDLCLYKLHHWFCAESNDYWIGFEVMDDDIVDVRSVLHSLGLFE